MPYSPDGLSPVRASVSGVAEPDVVLVPAGDALLGDPPRTEHVNVFAIARRPVSVADYATFLRESGHPAPKAWGGRPPDGQQPVENVSWADAVAYCRWLTVTTGKIYRLPDEREWEKAARREDTVELARGLNEWTNTWADGGRVVRRPDELATRAFTSGDHRGIGFRVVRGMTGR
jgi:formylglycine-generating enzyme required for sulfatase activity